MQGFRLGNTINNQFLVVKCKGNNIIIRYNVLVFKIDYYTGDGFIS